LRVRRKQAAVPRKGQRASNRAATGISDRDAALDLALRLHEHGDVDGAEAACCVGRPSTREGAYRLGQLLQDHGNMPASEAAFRRAIDRGHPDAAYNLGVLLERCGDTEAAEAAFRMAATTAGAVQEDRRSRNARLQRLDAYGRAAADGDPKAAVKLGRMSMEAGDLEAAEAAYRQAEQLDHPEAAYRLGTVLQARGDVAAAQSAYRRAEENGHLAAAEQLGRLLQQNGDPLGAADAFRRAAERRSARTRARAQAAAATTAAAAATNAAAAGPTTPATSQQLPPHHTPAAPPPAPYRSAGPFAPAGRVYKAPSRSAEPSAPAGQADRQERHALQDELVDAAPTLGLVVERCLVARYGVGWLEHVNRRIQHDNEEAGTNHMPVRAGAVRSDPRAALRLIAHDEALEVAFGAARRTARSLLGVANRLYHNESIEFRQLEPASRALRELCEIARDWES